MLFYLPLSWKEDTRKASCILPWKDLFLLPPPPPPEKVNTEGLLTPHKEFKPQKHALMLSHADNQQHLFQSANKPVAIWVSVNYPGHSALEKQEYLQVHWDTTTLCWWAVTPQFLGRIMLSRSFQGQNINYLVFDLSFCFSSFFKLWSNLTAQVPALPLNYSPTNFSSNLKFFPNGV